MRFWISETLSVLLVFPIEILSFSFLLVVGFHFARVGELGADPAVLRRCTGLLMNNPVLTVCSRGDASDPHCSPSSYGVLNSSPSAAPPPLRSLFSPCVWPLGPPPLGVWGLLLVEVTLGFCPSTAAQATASSMVKGPMPIGIVAQAIHLANHE